ncbi:MAG: hypothetical protein JST00_06925 [Deltaproteobacteria bacterium]|nr:hypothetical protein [Deltaproteobacteria bacterium]
MAIELGVHDRSMFEDAIEIAVHVAIGFHRVGAGGNERREHSETSADDRDAASTIHLIEGWCNGHARSKETSPRPLVLGRPKG